MFAPANSNRRTAFPCSLRCDVEFNQVLIVADLCSRKRSTWIRRGQENTLAFFREERSHTIKEKEDVPGSRGSCLPQPVYGAKWNGSWIAICGLARCRLCGV